MKIMENFMKRLNIRTNKSSFYWRSLSIMMTIMCLITALLGVFMYFFGTSYVEREIFRSHEAKIDVAVDRLKDNLTGIEGTMDNWSFSPMFMNSLDRLDWREDIDTVKDLSQQLFILRSSNGLLKRINVYLDTSRMVVTDGGIYTSPDDKLIDNYRSVMGQKQTRWSYSVISPDNDKGFGLSLSKPLVNTRGVLYGAIIFYINALELDKLLGELTQNEAGSAFFLQETGDWLVLPPASLREKSEMLQSKRQEVTRQMGSKEGKILFRWKGERYSTIFGELKLQGLNLTYVTSTPMSNISAPVRFMSVVILVINGLGLLAAMGLAWYSSKRLYRPVKNLIDLFSKEDNFENNKDKNMDEFEYIEKQWEKLAGQKEHFGRLLEKSLPSLKEGFLLKLVLGHFYSYHDEEILERMEQFGWNIRGKSFAVLAFRIFGISGSETDFTKGDEQLVTFAASNIIEELSRENPNLIGVINFQDLSVGMVVAIPSERRLEDAKSEMMKACREMVQVVSTTLKVDVVAVIGRSSYTLKCISMLMEEARRATRYRDIKEQTQVLDLEDIFEAGQEGLQYPFELENEIIQAVRMGLKEDSYRYMDAFLDEVAEKSGVEILLQQGALQLLGNIQYAMLRSGVNPYSLNQNENMYEQLMKIRDRVEIGEWFKRKLLKPYFDALAGTQDKYSRQIVEKAMEIIQREYVNEIFSRELCADTLQIKPHILSSAFKNVTGQNFIDFLSDYRLEKAKELLLCTDMKVNEIAEKVGYQSTYMFKVFKKNEGMTPGEYREKYINRIK